MKRLSMMLVLACGCAPLRFAEREVIWRDADDRPIAKPKEREFSVHWASARNMVFMPIDRGLALDFGHEADDTNALDELPDSSWYQDPRRDPESPGGRPLLLGAEKLKWGPASQDDLPVPPLVVTRGKQIGATPGFVVEDSRKVRFLVKLDPRGHANLATSTEVVASRLTWAGGWKVPKEVLFTFRSEDLSVSPKARGQDQFRDKVPFGAADLADIMTRVSRQPDGSILALASRWLPGEPLGSFTFDGVRRDNPNDRIAHQNRRAVRGYGTFAAWLNNVDTLENNNLDMYVGKAGQGHVEHYWQDVGGSFGVWAAQPAPYWMGHESYLSLPGILSSLFTLGIWTRPWYDERFRAAHDARVRQWPELAGFTADHFDPRTWKPSVYNPAFARQTARDRYWAAKRIAAFTADELRGAIAAGRYRPAAADRLFDILWRRREAILRAYLPLSSALDYFRFEDDRLCFDDLWLTAGLGGAPRYRAHESTTPLAVERRAGGSACLTPGAGAGYRVVTLDVGRQGDAQAAPEVKVHFKQRRILGIER